MLNFSLSRKTKADEADGLHDPLGDYFGTFSHRMRVDREREYNPYNIVLTEQQRKKKAEAESLWESALPGF